MSNIELLIGQSSTEGGGASAGRGWLCRNKKAPAADRGGQMSTISSGHLSTRDRDRERDIEIEKERVRNGTPRPAAYGRYHNVILSDTELDGLKTELPGKWEYITLTAYPAISLPAGGNTKPCSHDFQVGAGGRSQETKRAYPIIPVRGGRELMTNGFDEMILNMTDTTPEPED